MTDEEYKKAIRKAILRARRSWRMAEEEALKDLDERPGEYHEAIFQETQAFLRTLERLLEVGQGEVRFR